MVTICGHLVVRWVKTKLTTRCFYGCLPMTHDQGACHPEDPERGTKDLPLTSDNPRFFVVLRNPQHSSE